METIITKKILESCTECKYFKFHEPENSASSISAVECVSKNKYRSILLSRNSSKQLINTFLGFKGCKYGCLKQTSRCNSIW